MDPIGKISPPAFIQSGIDASGKLTGIMVFLNSILRLVFIAAGLWGFLNLIIAGYQFMSAGGDAKAVGKAWERIWQSLLGLLVIVASFLIAAIIGILFFKDATAILQPKLQ
ncbi:hypothetical protein HZB96_02980 [Candidatus Gottesmanbacteria bacterium]|nr:hypothetical protein [Candidatus Gottesmanbacteria bacterium]